MPKLNTKSESIFNTKKWNVKVKVQVGSKFIYRKRTDTMFNHEVDNDASDNSDTTIEDLNLACTAQS